MFSKFFSYIPNVAFVTSSATPVETNRPYSFSYPESQISSPRRCRNKLQGDGSDIFTSTYLTNVNSVWLHVLRVIFTYGAEIPPKGNVGGWIFVLFFNLLSEILLCKKRGLKSSFWLKIIGVLTGNCLVSSVNVSTFELCNQVDIQSRYGLT